MGRSRARADLRRRDAPARGGPADRLPRLLDPARRRPGSAARAAAGARRATGRARAGVPRPARARRRADGAAGRHGVAIPYDLRVTAPVVVIMAAGEGTRMRSRLPKLLHPLCGRPMIAWTVAAANAAGASKVVVVQGPGHELDQVLDHSVEFAIQEQPRGTADAVRAASALFDDAATVVVLNGDHPLISPDTIRELAEVHEHSGAAATIATSVLDDPRGYGRVVRGPDGTVERVVETKAPGDATELELHIREVNTGIYAFEPAELVRALDRVQGHNAQAELYLPDVVPILREDERTVLAHEVSDMGSTLQVNDRVQLANVRALAQRRIHEALMLAGVTIVDPLTTDIDVEVEIAADAVIAPF